jgi:hypothetical protein
LQNPQQQQYHVRLKLAMTASTAANSGACITAGNCKPLGAYSVWSAVPPQAAAGSSDGKPIILVVAQMDSIDMFHDAVQVRSTVSVTVTGTITGMSQCYMVGFGR